MTTDATTRLRPLTVKQESFVRNIFLGMTQREAWIAAGYSHNYSLPNVDINACLLFNSAKIQLRYRELQNKADSDAIGTVIERKKRLTEIYRANLCDFVDEKGNITLKPSAALAEVVIEERVVDQEESLSVRTKRLKLRDPVEAIKEQNRMERIGQDEKHEFNDNRHYNFVIMGDENKAKLQQLLNGERPKVIEATR